MSPTQASSGSIPTSLTTPKPRKPKIIAPLCGPFWIVRKSNLPTSYCSRISWIICSTGIPLSLDEDMIFNYHSTWTSTGSTKVGNTEPCSDTKKRRSESQHTDCLQRTQASMFSWNTYIQFRPSISHSTLTAYSFFQTNITRPRDIQVPCIPHNNRAGFT
jgi:hypothetical protein